MAVERDADNDSDIFELWTREETPVLTLPLPLNDDEESNSTDFPRRTLTLRQYPSDDDNWGIHGTVWDGGVAQLAYMHRYWAQEFAARNGDGRRISFDVIDLGSGTGVLGLGIFLLNNFHRKEMANEVRVSYRTVVLTDLQEAVPLLEENMKLNQSTKNQTSCSDKTIHDVPRNLKCYAQELCWGAEEFSKRIQAVFTRIEMEGSRANHILVTGADIVYRQNLFEPLLETMRGLAIQAKDASRITFLFSSQSIRTHLHEFWCLSNEQGWTVVPKATVRVDEDPSKIPDTQDVFQEQSCPSDPWDLVKDKIAPGVVLVYEMNPSFLSKSK